MVPSATANVIDLHFNNETGRVRITPSSEDLMVLSVAHAIQACRAYDQQIRFNSQFELLLSRLGVWIKEHSESIAEAFLTTRDAGLLFLIVSKEASYDDNLESDITELEIDIANDNDYYLIGLNVLAIPNCSRDGMQSFLSKKMQLRYVVD